RMILLAFPRSQRGTGMGVRQTGVPIGGVVAALRLPPLVAVSDLRAGLAALGAVTLVGGLVSLALAGVEERRPAGDRTRASARPWLSLAPGRQPTLGHHWGPSDK